MNENEVRFRGKKVVENESDKEQKVCVEDKDEFKVDLSKTFWLTRIVFLRGLAFIYFIAFLVSYNQNKELIGDNGLLPANLYLSRIKENVGGQLSSLQLFFKVPTLFWFLDSYDNMDYYLDLTAMIGMVISLIVFVLGSANALLMFSLWILYHSIVNVGQAWFSFGWESQLLETGFLAIWIVPLLSLSRY